MLLGYLASAYGLWKLKPQNVELSNIWLTYRMNAGVKFQNYQGDKILDLDKERCMVALFNLMH